MLKTILKIIWGFFAIIGIIVVAGALYLYIVDPFNLKVLLRPTPSTPTTAADQQTNQPGTTPPPTAKSPLTQQQQAAAQQLGLDPNSLTSKLTPATEQCAVAALGQQRVNELKADAAPSPMDLLKAGHCLGQ